MAKHTWLRAERHAATEGEASRKGRGGGEESEEERVWGRRLYKGSSGLMSLFLVQYRWKICPILRFWQTVNCKVASVRLEDVTTGPATGHDFTYGNSIPANRVVVEQTKDKKVHRK